MARAGFEIKGDWGWLKDRSRNLPFLMSEIRKETVPKIGEEGRKILRKNIVDGDFKPNAPATIFLKSSDTPLLDTGRMRNEIKIYDDETEVSIGWEPELSVRAGVNDEGATIRVTQKMRSYLAAHDIFLAEKTKTIRIPARPFMDKSQDEIAEMAGEVVVNFLTGSGV